MIVHGCTSFNNSRYSLRTNKSQNSKRTQIINNRNKVGVPSFTALKELNFAKRFDPEKSASAYEFMKNFNLSYAIRDLCKNYDVKATITTDWYKKHPRIPHKESPYYIASLTTLLLAAKKIKPEYDIGTQDPADFDRERYYYVGMYGDYSITGSEENFAYFLKCKEAAKAMNIPLPKQEEIEMTNFIR